MVVLTTLLIALRAGEMLSFTGGRCQSPVWLSPSCPHAQPGKGCKKPCAYIPWGQVPLEESWKGWRRPP